MTGVCGALCGCLMCDWRGTEIVVGREVFQVIIRGVVGQLNWWRMWHKMDGRLIGGWLWGTERIMFVEMSFSIHHICHC